MRRILTLLAGFAFGIHVAVMLHEVGHAFGYWLRGGTVTAIRMATPLPFGDVQPHAYDSFMYVWGGVGFGLLFTLGPLALANFFSVGSVGRFLALLATALGLAHNALYLVVGALAPFGDAEDMIHLGAPRWFLLLLGLPVLAGFVYCLALAILMVGISVQAAVWKWILITECGLLPIPALLVIGNRFSTNTDAVKFSVTLLGGCFALCFGAAAALARSLALRRGDEFEKGLLRQSWSVPLTVFAWVLLVIVFEGLVFAWR